MLTICKATIDYCEPLHLSHSVWWQSKSHDTGPINHSSSSVNFQSNPFQNYLFYNQCYMELMGDRTPKGEARAHTHTQSVRVSQTDPIKCNALEYITTATPPNGQHHPRSHHHRNQRVFSKCTQWKFHWSNVHPIYRISNIYIKTERSFIRQQQQKLHTPNRTF